MPTLAELGEISKGIGPKDVGRAARGIGDSLPSWLSHPRRTIHEILDDPELARKATEHGGNIGRGISEELNQGTGALKRNLALGGLGAGLGAGAGATYGTYAGHQLWNKHQREKSKRGAGQRRRGRLKGMDSRSYVR